MIGIPRWSRLIKVSYYLNEVDSIFTFVSKESYLESNKALNAYCKSKARVIPKRKEIAVEEKKTVEVIIDETLAFFTFEDIYTNFNTIQPRSGPASKVQHIAELVPEASIIGSQNLQNKLESNKKLRKKIIRKEQSLNQTPDTILNKSNDLYSNFKRYESEMSATTASSESKLKNINRFKKSLKEGSNFYVDCLLPPMEDRYFPFAESAELLLPTFIMQKRLIPIKEDKMPNNCISCGWIFPSKMKIDSINLHINLCLDGLGDIAKDQSISEQLYQPKIDVLKLNEISFPARKSFSKTKLKP